MIKKNGGVMKFAINPRGDIQKSASQLVNVLKSIVFKKQCDGCLDFFAKPFYTNKIGQEFCKKCVKSLEKDPLERKWVVRCDTCDEIYNWDSVYTEWIVGIDDFIDTPPLCDSCGIDGWQEKNM